MIQRDSFLVYCEDWRFCIASKRVARVLTISAEAAGTTMIECARMIPGTAVFKLRAAQVDA